MTQDLLLLGPVVMSNLSERLLCLKVPVSISFTSLLAVLIHQELFVLATRNYQPLVSAGNGAPQERNAGHRRPPRSDSPHTAWKVWLFLMLVGSKPNDSGDHLQLPDLFCSLLKHPSFWPKLDVTGANGHETAASVTPEVASMPQQQ